MKDFVVISDAYIGVCTGCPLEDDCPVLKGEWIGLQSDGHRYWIRDKEIPVECGSRFMKVQSSCHKARAHPVNS